MNGKQWKQAAEAAVKDQLELVLLTKVQSVTLFRDSFYEHLIAVAVMQVGQVRVFWSTTPPAGVPEFFEINEFGLRRRNRVQVMLPKVGSEGE